MPITGKPWYRILYIQVLIGVALGIGIGAFFPEIGKSLKPLGDAFVKLVKMMIAPIIFCTVVHGIASMGDMKKLGRVGFKTLLYFEIVSTLALLIGLVVVNILKPGEGFNIDPSSLDPSLSIGYAQKAKGHSMVDFFLLLKISGAGDELQGIKRGIMEMADAIVINKADGDNIKKANLAKIEFSRALHLFPLKKSGWTPTTSTCSAITKEGIEEVWKTILKFLEATKENNYFFEKRKEQNLFWMMETINEQLKLNFYNDPEIQKLLDSTKKAVTTDEISPFAAAQLLLKKYFKK